MLGGKLVYQYTKKRASGPKCPVTEKRIQGVSDAFFVYDVYIFYYRLLDMTQNSLEFNSSCLHPQYNFRKPIPV
jgi:Ribosomal protein L34e